jgi:hypothetical protein
MGEWRYSSTILLPLISALDGSESEMDMGRQYKTDPRETWYANGRRI